MAKAYKTTPNYFKRIASTGLVFLKKTTDKFGIGTLTPSEALDVVGNIKASGTLEGSNVSGTNTGDQTITLTGDVTGTGDGEFAATITDKAVTLAKMDDLPAETIIGNDEEAPGIPKALTVAEAQALLNVLENPMSNPGEMIVGGVSGTPTVIDPDLTDTRKYLSSVSTGGVANAPTWELIPAVTAITVENEETDTDCYLAFFVDATGDLGPKTSAFFPIDSDIGSLGSHIFKLDSGGFIADANGNELIKATATGSAVNEITVANAATGGKPTISATGGDDNIDLELTPKGTGRTKVDTDISVDVIPLGVGLETSKGAGYLPIPDKLDGYILKAVGCRVHKPSNNGDIELQLTRERLKGAIGASDTQWDITNTAGNTWRYTWDTTGTDPACSTNMVVGDQVYVQAENFDPTNNGLFEVSAVAATYFEVAHLAGVGKAETDKTTGAGIINDITCRAMLSTTTKIPDLYFDNSADSSYAINTSYDDVLKNDVIRFDIVDEGEDAEGLMFWLTFKKT